MFVTRERRPVFVGDPHQYIPQQSPAKTFKSSGAQQIIGFRPPEHRSPHHGYEDEGNDPMLDFKVERILAVEVPLKMKPLQDVVMALQAKVGNMDDTSAKAIDDLKSRVTNIEYNIKSVSGRAAEHKEEVHRMVNELNQANVRSRDCIKEAIARLTSLEGRFSMLEEELRGITQKQHSLEHKVSHQIMQINTSIDNIGRSASENVNSLASQVESLNRETQATFTSMGRQIRNVSVVMTDSLNQLSSTTRDSLQILRSDNDEVIAQLERQVEQSTAETAQAINQLEQEVIQTFSSTRALINSSHTSLESAITTESTTRKRNEQQLLDAYNTAISNATKAIQKLEGDHQQHIEQTCTNFLASWKNDITTCMADMSNTITASQERTAAIEKKLEAISKRQPDTHPFDDRPLKPAKNVTESVSKHQSDTLPFDERPIKPAKHAVDHVSKDESDTLPFDERPIRPAKQEHAMELVSNGMIFRRRPTQDTRQSSVKVMIAEPRIPKQPMGMVLSLHGKYHSGRRRSKVSSRVELAPDPDFVAFPTFRDEPSLAECAFLAQKR